MDQKRAVGNLIKIDTEAVILRARLDLLDGLKRKLPGGCARGPGVDFTEEERDLVEALGLDIGTFVERKDEVVTYRLIPKVDGI